jgi:acetylornithine deacetylase/succinyl-diaminopimelate desuccinylase-like protein
MGAWRAYLDESYPRLLTELSELLSIPSVSGDPERVLDVQRAADWVAARLAAAGAATVQALPIAGHPILYAAWPHTPGMPTVLLYGHFDVVPAGPLDRWTSSPYEPAVRDGRLYARGAADSKGSLLPAIAAVEALLQTRGTLPVNVKALIEGQEEIGSPDLPAVIAAHQSLLACDVVINTDGGRGGADPPQLVIGTRGICSVQVDVRGPRPALHAGTYGGIVQSPVRALVRLLDSVLDTAGRIQLAGFYDDVVPLAPADRAALAELPFNEAAFAEHAGVTELVGEPGYTPTERLGARPAVSMAGISVEGSPGTIPSAAQARLICLLVPDQDPARVAEQVAAHLRAHALPGVTVSTRPLVQVLPYLASTDHPAIRVARTLLGELRGMAPVVVRLGFGVPACGLFLRHLGAHSVFFGLTAGDEGAHGPDEFIRLATLNDAQTAYAALLERFGEEEMGILGTSG